MSPRHHVSRLLAGLLLAGTASGTLLGPSGASAANVTATADFPSAAPVIRPRTPAETPGGTGEPVLCERGTTNYIDQVPLAFDLLGVDRAQRLSKGADVKVAVIDSGVDPGNAHLTEVTDPGRAVVGGGDGRADIEGHGTAVAGIIAAQPVEGSGVVGVAPEARILPVRVYEATQAQGPGSTPIPPAPGPTAEGIRWAAQQGAKIIVVALSTSMDDPALASAVAEAHAAGSLVVASAGNRETAAEGDQADGVRYPAGYPQVLSVAASTNQGGPSDASIHGVHVGIAAPGQEVLAPWFADGDCVISAESPSSSFATAYVGGVAALVASAHPDESPDLWKWRLEATALRASADERTDELGWGIVAPYDALTITPSADFPGPALPGGTPPPQAAQTGRTPPDPIEDPMILRGFVGVIVTGAGVIGAGLLWLRHRGRDLTRRARQRRGVNGGGVS